MKVEQHGESAAMYRAAHAEAEPEQQAFDVPGRDMPEDRSTQNM